MLAKNNRLIKNGLNLSLNKVAFLNVGFCIHWILQRFFWTFIDGIYPWNSRDLNPQMRDGVRLGLQKKY